MEVTSKEQKKSRTTAAKPAHRTAPNQEFQFHEALPPGSPQKQLGCERQIWSGHTDFTSKGRKRKK